MKIERLKADLEKARQKAAEWQARAKDIENMEIIQTVRSVTASPEELKTILGLIQSMKGLPQEKPVKEEETEPYEN